MAVNITTSSSVTSPPVDLKTNNTETATAPSLNGPATLPDLPKFIPTGLSGRTLVLCFDGTGDQSVFSSYDLHLPS